LEFRKAGGNVPVTAEITRLLASWQQGDRSALEELFPLIRTELQRMALRQLQREQGGRPLQPSSLVQETFVRLLSKQPAGWENRGHFFAVASTVMRHLLVDHARRRHREKRGGAAPHVPLDGTDPLSPEQVEEIVAIDIALQRLAEWDERKSRIFELRFFGGLTLEETAEALGVGTRTVVREWRLARAWLRRELSHENVSHGPSAAD
jgi:RNA polymerase sigma factor (TIGR02999 family)